MAASKSDRAATECCGPRRLASSSVVLLNAPRLRSSSREAIRPIALTLRTVRMMTRKWVLAELTVLARRWIAQM